MLAESLVNEWSTLGLSGEQENLGSADIFGHKCLVVIISDFDRTVTYELSCLLSEVLSVHRIWVSYIRNGSWEGRIDSVSGKLFDIFFLANISL